jgi:hypothetical protein
MPAIPALGRLRQEDYKFKANLGYRVKPCLKKNQTKKSNSSKIFKLCALKTPSTK